MTKAVEHRFMNSPPSARARLRRRSSRTSTLVQSYGSHMKLKQLAMISTPESRLIRISPDPGTIKDIERAINESKLGEPSVEGKVIRLPARVVGGAPAADGKDDPADGREVSPARRDALEGLKKSRKTVSSPRTISAAERRFKR
jgi:ribosome recycling factor